jgi:hypothetical protein
MDTNNTPTKDSVDKTFWMIFFILLILIWSVGCYYGSKMIVGIVKPLIATRQYVNPIYLRAPKNVRSIFEIPDVGMVAKICTTHKAMFWAFDSLVSDSSFEIYCRMAGEVSMMSNAPVQRHGGEESQKKNENE